MENKKQTAVEWLEEQFEESYSYINEIFKETIKKAKEMENREIRFDIEEKWKQFRSTTNNEDAWLFKEWLIEQTYGGDK
jgi:hypothetical protein